jgi:hypothetical protein
MSKAKTIGDFERERNIMVRGADPKKTVTADEFDKLVGPHFENAVGIMHEDREAWLKEQGYEVTRENMMDVALPNKPARIRGAKRAFGLLALHPGRVKVTSSLFNESAVKVRQRHFL